MKNSCLYDERWNPNDDVVGDIRKNITNMVFDAWWRQNWFRRSRFVSMFFLSLWKLVGKCAKFLRPCNITKSRLVSRLRFFFLHLMMTPNDDNFFIRAKCLECHSNRSILFFSVFVCQTCSRHWGFVSPMKIHPFLFLFCDPKYFLLIEKQKKIHYTSDDGCFQASQMLRRLSFLRVSVF